jgi:hypothetical protein
MRIGHHLLEIELVPFLVDEGEAVDKRRPMAVGIQPGLKFRQTLCQFNQQTTLSRHLIDQQTRPSIAEGDLGYVDPVLEQTKKR